MRRIAEALLIGAIGVVLIGACLFAYLYWISGPDIQITSSDAASGVEVDTRFLGEYHLGLTRLAVSTKSGETVVDLRSEGARIPNVFRLVPGINHLRTFSQQGASEALEPFILEAHRTYSIEVCGNGGLGNVRCLSGEFTL